jgi:hypothetical protein
MSATNPFLIFTDRLNQLRVRYMVTGSVASMAYGERDIEGILAVSAAARAGAQYRPPRRARCLGEGAASTPVRRLRQPGR